MKQFIIALVLFFLIIGGVVYRYIQLIPRNVGIGEVGESPDKRYEARATDYYSESFWGHTRHWFQFEIASVRTGLVLQSLETTPIEGADLESRSGRRVIHWAEDSNDVTFTFPTVDITMRLRPKKDPE